MAGTCVRRVLGLSGSVTRRRILKSIIKDVQTSHKPNKIRMKRAEAMNRFGPKSISYNFQLRIQKKTTAER